MAAGPVGVVGILAGGSNAGWIAIAASAVLAYAALIGVHFHERRRYGLAGSIGIGLVVAGPPLAIVYVGFLMIPIGVVLMGIAIAFRGSLPRGAAILMASSAGVAFLGVGAGGFAAAVCAVAFLASVAWLGYALWRSPRPRLQSDAG